MEGGALSDPAFPEFAKSVVLYLHNTSRVEGVKYDGLLREKGFGGFPTLAFMDAEGNVMTSRVDRSVDGFKRVAGALASVAALEAADKQKPLQGDEAVKLVFAQLDLDKVKFNDAKARLDKLEGVSAENQKAIAQRATDFDVGEVFAKHQKGLQGVAPTERAAAMQKMQQDVAKDLQAFVAAGRMPSDKGAFRFWSALYQAAKRGNDAEGIARAQQELEALATRDPSVKRMVDTTLNPPKRVDGMRAIPLGEPGGGGVPAPAGGTASGKKD